MNTLLQIRSFLMILIPIGVTVRAVSCLIYMSVSDNPDYYKKRLRNALIFLVVAETILGLAGAGGIVRRYIGGIIWG